jgi:hypothetical protein
MCAEDGKRMKTSWMRVAAVAVGIALPAISAFAGRAEAQEKPDAPAAQVSEQAQQEHKTSVSDQVFKKTPLELFLGFKPNLAPFETRDNAPPMRARQKYAFAFHEAEDFKAHVGNVLQAAFQQGFDSQPHYGQGWGPYAQRYGAAEADQVTSCFFIYGFFPHLLKTDPRYFRKKHGSVWSRMNYAASRTLITKKDSGGLTFNTPQVVGQLFQSGISTAYYPQRDRDPGQVFQSWGMSLLFNSGYNIASEFYPDIWRKVFHRK